MAQFLQILQHIGTAIGYLVVVLLCLSGVVLSCLSLFGAWMVAAAALLTWFLAGPEFPGLWTFVAFIMVAGALEGVEALAGAWGVTRRGGSGFAGFCALVGGLLGFLLGSLIPIPVLGSLLGMLVGSFALAFLVERHRLQHAGHAAHIAWGTVTARIIVIFLKVTATLGMIGWLFFALFFLS